MIRLLPIVWRKYPGFVFVFFHDLVLRRRDDRHFLHV